MMCPNRTDRGNNNGCSYVAAKDNREKVDIKTLNEEIATTVKKISLLRADIDTIIKEIEA